MDSKADLGETIMDLAPEEQILLVQAGNGIHEKKECHRSRDETAPGVRKKKDRRKGIGRKELTGNRRSSPNRPLAPGCHAKPSINKGGSRNQCPEAETASIKRVPGQPCAFREHLHDIVKIHASREGQGGEHQNSTTASEPPGCRGVLYTGCLEGAWRKKGGKAYASFFWFLGKSLRAGELAQESCRGACPARGGVPTRSGGLWVP